MTDIRPLLSNRIVWYVAAGLLLAQLPLLKYGQFWWRLPRNEKLAMLFVAGVFAAACIAALFFERERTWSAAGRTLVRSMAILGVFLLALAALDRNAPAYLLLPLFATLALVIPLSVSPLARSIVPVILLGAATVGVAGYAMSHVQRERPSEPTVRRSYLQTAFYTLEAMSFERYVPRPATRGGALDLLGEKVLLSTGDGALYLLDFPQGATAPIVERLRTRVPNNREEFAAAFGGSANAPTTAAEWTDAGPPRVQTWRFRVADVIAIRDANRVRLLASHHWWKGEEDCLVVRISELTVPAHEFPANVEHAEWRTFYETTPCIPMRGPMRLRGKNPFHGEEIGGRLALLDERTLLLTLGDHGFSGIESPLVFAQDPDAAYGKTMLIDLATGRSRVFTMGHRNPQGLYVTREGLIWQTEHGAQGGDEVNVLVEGGNYGWPRVTYGTNYGSTVWPIGEAQGVHDGYRAPQYAWLPSIGISPIIRIEGDALFSIWQGSLLAGSLATRSLYRLVTEGERIVLSEPIALGKRVRDILEMPDGRILVWTDDAALVMLAPAKGDDGATLFAVQCSGCHTIEDGMSHRIGPDLHAVLGRSMGSASGFDDYSPAMRAQRGAWTRERLDRFLQDPQGVVPGTSMAFAGIVDARQRAAIIDYLSKSASPR